MVPEIAIEFIRPLWVGSGRYNRSAIGQKRAFDDFIMHDLRGAFAPYFLSEFYVRSSHDES